MARTIHFQRNDDEFRFVLIVLMDFYSTTCSNR